MEEEDEFAKKTYGKHPQTLPKEKIKRKESGTCMKDERGSIIKPETFKPNKKMIRSFTMHPPGKTTQSQQKGRRTDEREKERACWRSKEKWRWEVKKGALSYEGEVGLGGRRMNDVLQHGGDHLRLRAGKKNPQYFRRNGDDLSPSRFFIFFLSLASETELPY